MADRIRPPRYTTTDSLSVPFLQTSKDSKPTLLQQLKTRFVYGAPNFALLSGDAGMHLAQKVGAYLGQEIPANPPAFSNNETRVVVPPSVATKDVYVIQSTDGNPDVALTQLKLLEEGAKGVGANRISVVLTHLLYGRQDKREQLGAPEAARLFGKEIIVAGSHDPQKRHHESKLTADAMLMVVDVHSENPLNALTKNNGYQWANLDSSVVLIPAIQEALQTEEFAPVIAFPDKGAADRYKNYAGLFGGNFEDAAVIDKVRDYDKNNVVAIAETQESLAPKVAGRIAVLIDDIIDSGGTTLQAAQLLKAQGAAKVLVVATHGIFSGSALEKMSHDAIDGIIVTDSIAHRDEVVANPKIHVVSLAPLIAEAIRRIEKRQPLGDLAKKMSPDFERSYMKMTKINRYRRRSARQNESEAQLAA